MKKFIFGIVAIIVEGIVVVSLPKQGKEEDKQVENASDETIEGDDDLYIGTLSDKDIYFKADMVLSDNPVIHDMMDVANGYAILRSAYCDAELWFMFGNSAPLEHMMLFPEILEDGDEADDESIFSYNSNIFINFLGLFRNNAYLCSVRT